MLATAFAKRMDLQESSRLSIWPHEARISTAELALLLACGALATIAVGAIQLRIGVPGNAILRGVIPMALGVSLVPRRSAGMVMAIGAALTAAVMTVGQVGHFQPAALLSVLLLGPVLDAVLAGHATGWQLYARFAAAGVVANVIAFAVRFGIALGGWEIPGGRQFSAFWRTALVSFVMCGAAAGFLSAALWFRLRVNNDLRRPR